MVDNLDVVKSIGKSIGEELVKGNFDHIGEIFHRHWEVKKQRDSLVSNPKVDEMYELARSKGALGGKLVGLGGGGYLLLYSNCELGELNCIPVGLDMEGCKVVYEG